MFVRRIWVKRITSALVTVNLPTTYLCPGGTSGYMACLGVYAHISNNKNSKCSLVSMSGVNYVLPCTTEEPDIARVSLEPNIFTATTGAEMLSATATCHLTTWRSTLILFM